MKKTLVSALTAALAVGAASTTFAASNPFSDVPQGHWAYDAVSQLAADGVIEGYGDGTYQGDKTITRYEMAQMVAKAMAKESSASAADKALIDKLAAEYADELNNLGVRVSNLERNADMVKWNGEMRYTYAKQKADGQDNTSNEFKFRLEPSAEVNSHWHVRSRLDATTNASEDGESNVSLKRLYADGDYSNWNIKLGKLPEQIDGNLFDTQLSGGAIAVGNDLKFTVEGGRMNLGRNNLTNDLVNEACTQSGIILAITGAGGAFGKIINETGIGKQLVEGMTGLTDGTGALILVAAFIISQVLRAAQGSTTVALVTTAAIFAPVVTGLEGVSPLLAALAICAGGIGLSLPNDSGFWVVNRFGKFDVPGTMRVWTVGGTISGVTALIVVLILSIFTTSLPGLL